ncbi:MAG: hypothetical protein J0L56_20525 [Chitinophagales bacterium]|nr:hypothetical protein [Chitinophagales bacterium]
MSQKHLIETAQIIRNVRKETLRTVEGAILYTYFNVGRIIHQDEQRNKNLLPEEMLSEISKQLVKENGKSYSVENLVLFKRFYILYSARFSDNEVQKIFKAWSANLTTIPQYDPVVKLFKKRFRLTWPYYQFPLIRASIFINS